MDKAQRAMMRCQIPAMMRAPAPIHTKAQMWSGTKASTKVVNWVLGGALM